MFNRHSGIAIQKHDRHRFAHNITVSHNNKLLPFDGNVFVLKHADNAFRSRRDEGFNKSAMENKLAA